MTMSKDKKIEGYAPDPGHQITFLDSAPPPGRVGLLAPFQFIVSSIYTSFTGTVPKPLLPGSLRLIWYLHNGKENMRDYTLLQASVVGEYYDFLRGHEEVRRVVVIGYSGQNPWAENRGEKDAKWREIEAEVRRARIAKAKLKRKGDGSGKSNTCYEGDVKARTSFDVDDELES